MQINLLTEQKIAKLIGLMEELREDIPNIRDRHDWEAQIMQQATEPQIVLNILQENLEQPETELPKLADEQKTNSPKFTYWHVWTDDNGVSHQSKCELTNFQQESMS